MAYAPESTIAPLPDDDICLVPHQWIEMSDGTRLSARMWMPASVAERPVPAVLEYIPYRKDDATTAGDEEMWRYVARQGYACVRVDIRGSGDSEGILHGEYLEQEQLDGVEVIAWIAEQEWCTGAVGMIGISWGGFNSLQVAAHRPPALKAIVSVCSTDDRYADDIHYMGGCILGVDMLSWATTMLGYNARPPTPEIVGDTWRQSWLERIERTPAFVEDWLLHKRRDDFWKNGSVCEDYGDLDCAVYMVGGWADAYRNAILRVLEGYTGPRKGLIGPWAHNYPYNGRPGPAIGFLQETVRWWDHWLKCEDTGIMDEPMLRAWIPSADGIAESGRWVAETDWPAPGVETQELGLAAGARLESGPVTTSDSLSVPRSLAHGQAAGDWLGYGRQVDTAGDQRGEDGHCLLFDGTPLGESLELLGRPSLSCTVVSDRPNALVAVRLCDVAADGSSRLITRGVLNLTHRDSHESPTALTPGDAYDVTVHLNAIGYTVPAGHRIRVAIASAYWPWAWPSPAPVALQLLTGPTTTLRLPVRPPVATDTDLVPFDTPLAGDLALVAETVSGPEGRVVTHDVATGTLKVRTDFAYFGTIRHHDGTRYHELAHDEQTITLGDPLSAIASSGRTITIEKADWRIRVEATASLTSTANTFEITNEIDAFEGKTRIATQRVRRSIPRDLV